MISPALLTLMVEEDELFGARSSVMAVEVEGSPVICAKEMLSDVPLASVVVLKMMFVGSGEKSTRVLVEYVPEKRA